MDIEVILETVGAWLFFMLTVVNHWLPLVLTVFIFPLLGRLYRLHKEQQHMIKRKLFENTGVVIFGVFDGQLQSDYLDGFLTTLFGERLFNLIVGWNDQPSPHIIMPPTSYESEHLKEILAARASPSILQSRHIDCYFKGTEVFGTPSYPFAKFILALARPDANKLTCHDYPRLIVIEVGALAAITQRSDIKPQTPTQNGYTWLETVRELGRMYLSGKHDSLAVLEVPLNREVTKHPVPKSDGQLIRA